MSSEDSDTTNVGKVNLNGANVAGGTFMDRAILRDRLVAQDSASRAMCPFEVSTRRGA